jgi:hypothetical protein
MDDVRRIADAVLYEGYLLWPYRRSAMKNQRRWTFGGVYPEAHSLRHPDDRCVMSTQCLLVAGEQDGLAVDVSVRFLHVVARDVVHDTPSGPERVDELTVAGTRHLAWDEATEREIASGRLSLEELLAGRRLPILVAAGSEEEELLDDDDGRRGGAIVRRWERLEGAVDLRAERLGGDLLRLTVRVANASPFAAPTRQEALRWTFCSTHAVLHADGGRFVSLTDPPAALAEAASACVNEGVWPVLVGPDASASTVLASPIILEDHPRIAPESPGDLFDGGEIDQLLTLSILSLTDAERAEMRDADPRARAILERTEALTQEQLLALHGRLRDREALP